MEQANKEKQQAADGGLDNMAMAFARLQRAVVELEICFALRNVQGLIAVDKSIRTQLAALGKSITLAFKGAQDGQEEKPHSEASEGRSEDAEEQPGNEAKS